MPTRICHVALLAAALTGDSALAQYAAVILHPAGRSSSTATGARPGSQVGATGSTPFTSNHAALWTGSAGTYRDLHPATGYFRSFATGTDGATQVGYGTIDPSGAIRTHALLWRGSAASVLDLHPAVTGYDTSVLNGADGGLQAGSISGTQEVEEHAGLWAGTAASFTDLHPAAFRNSRAMGIGGGAQVGDGQNQEFDTHALLWHGTAASAVDLHPAGYSGSHAFATDGTQQGGEGEGVFGERFETHALLWTGSAATVVDLHPEGFDSSDVRGVASGVQVGHIAGLTTGFDDHAAAWRGAAGTLVDLHQFLPSNAVDSRALGVSPDGTIAGEAGMPTGIVAVLWIPVPHPCYANCDNSTAAPALNVADFTCFLQRFGAGDLYANCDASTQAPVLNVADFTCFLQQFAAGCN